MKWITRERARVDRIACPWLISRFIDKEPAFLFAPADQVRVVAGREGAPDWEFTMGLTFGFSLPKASQ
jgi:hypothetical protein